ncbi:guanine nucleotide-binding protein subunit gamma 3-like isoform X2 [Actinidia eriantha]|uniref:guanine nucleotide-binding protein subunit gamma 3-like isoform X2 n=1 Tax=Actinidia eriantha TaxID=165200 RepID=UPI002582B28C|nr:guanine nucleotide-binding protein subunit gamma 3-like isoform X2 [Actinidia eriantha]
MAGSSCSSSSVVPSLPLPRPKSPPEYPDLYGKRREVAKVQMLEREITFLEGELKLVESLQPASRSCKEVADYVGANSDPFIPTSRKIRRSCSFWKWLWLCFFCICLVHYEPCGFCVEDEFCETISPYYTNSADHPVLTFHGFAVLAALLVSKCHTAAAIAIYVISIHVLVVQCQNAGVVAFGHNRDASTRSHAAANAAFHDVLRAAPIALAL